MTRGSRFVGCQPNSRHRRPFVGPRLDRGHPLPIVVDRSPEEMRMTKRTLHKAASLGGSVALGIALAAIPFASAYAQSDESKIKQGYAINPVPLNLAGKNRASVGLGSYIVNTGGCNDCHTHPSFAPGHNPVLGQPEQVNTTQFLAGGMMFGPFIKSANLTPDALGRPAGLTLEEFMTLLRTGHDPDAPPGTLLQVMPWPAFGKKTDQDLKAIYDYLSAIPSLPDNPNPGP
jgi:hypothetical protein